MSTQTEIKAIRQNHRAQNPQSERDFIKAQIQVCDNLRQSLNIETACKNQAYYFILSNGLFDKFKKYANQNPL